MILKYLTLYLLTLRLAVCVFTSAGSLQTAASDVRLNPSSLEPVRSPSPLERRVSKRNGDNVFQTCLDNFEIHQDQIIRTQDSRAMGARYINERDVPSRDDCLRLCCETAECDVFVFEERSPGSCYLFQCGSQDDFKCKFTKHRNYTSAVLSGNRHMTELESQIKLTKHEHELTNLRQPDEIATVVIPMSGAGTDTTTPPGNKETDQVIPATSNNDSSNNRHCSRYQFECRTSGECIAIYNACDGIPQCTDGSDEGAELGCPTIMTTIGPIDRVSQGEILPALGNVKANINKVPSSLPTQNLQQGESVPLGSDSLIIQPNKQYKSNSWIQQQPSSYGMEEQQQQEYNHHMHQQQQNLQPNGNYMQNGGNILQQQTMAISPQQLQLQQQQQQHQQQQQQQQQQQPPPSQQPKHRHQQQKQLPVGTGLDGMQPPPQLVNQAKLYGREGEGLLYHGAGQNENMQWPPGSYQQDGNMAPNNIIPYHANNNNGMSQIFNHKGNGLVSQSERYRLQNHMFVNKAMAMEGGTSGQFSDSLQNDYNGHYNNYVDNSQGYRMFPSNVQQNNWPNIHKAHEMANVDDPLAGSREDVPVQSNLPAMAPDYYYEENNLRNKIQQQFMGAGQRMMPQNRLLTNERIVTENIKELKNSGGIEEITLDHVNHEIPSTGQGTVKKDSAHHAASPSSSSSATSAVNPTEKPKEMKSHNSHHISHNSHRKMEQLTAEVTLRETTFEGASAEGNGSPSGAILSLTLGMCVTGVMIILVGCRMRTVRRRMRRGGKSAYAHDADFLVNGMYL